MARNMEELEKYLSNWQKVLKLEDWDLSIKLVDFSRTDYVQTGDISVDVKNKKAVVLISKNDTGKDVNTVILHELVHLILWELDHFAEERISAKDKKTYFEYLESTTEQLTDIIKNLP